MRRPLFGQVSIIGPGLIGGSLGMALRRGGIARRVIGLSRSERTIRRAITRRAIHDGDTELCPNWLRDSDLVVLAVPPAYVVPLARKVARLTQHSFILTDVASVKGPIVSVLERTLPTRICFVGSHPMAGSEESGIDAADPDLFRGATCVLTRTTKMRPAALRRVGRMWQRVGCRIVFLAPNRHDRLVAQISHIPHLTAVALTLFPVSTALPLSGGGYTDSTRIALSDPSMWGQIFRMNQKEVSRGLNRLIAELVQLRNLVSRGHPSKLRLRLQAAQRRRKLL